MIADDYKAKRPLYEQLSVELARLLSQLSASYSVTEAVIEKRVKTQDSLEEKIIRPEKVGKYTDLRDITDLCGVRIVLFTQRDCQIITKAISENFDIDQNNSVFKSYLEDDRFGYRSTHLVISLPRTRTALFDLRQLEGLKAEVQIRTVLQHAWAVLDWKLRYKTEIEVPAELRRRLFRISALLETADEAFGELQSSADRLRQSYASSIEAGDLDISINRDSLEKFFKSIIVQELLQKCRDRGVKIIDPAPNVGSAPYDYLIRTLAECGISTLKQFKDILKSVENEHINALEKVSNISGRIFGVFTPLRIVVLAQKEIETRRRVMLVVETDSGGIKEAETYVLLNSK